MGKFLGEQIFGEKEGEFSMLASKYNVFSDDKGKVKRTLLHDTGNERCIRQWFLGRANAKMVMQVPSTSSRTKGTRVRGKEERGQVQVMITSCGIGPRWLMHGNAVLCQNTLTGKSVRAIENLATMDKCNSGATTKCVLATKRCNMDFFKMHSWKPDPGTLPYILVNGEKDEETGKDERRHLAVEGLNTP